MLSTTAGLRRPSPVNLGQQLEIGIVDEAITANTRGRVYFDATYWPARLYDASQYEKLQPSETVYVVGRQGLTLLVIPKS